MKKKAVMDILKNAYVSSLDGAGGVKNVFVYREDSAEEVESEIHRKAKKSNRPFRIRKGPVQFYRDLPVIKLKKIQGKNGIIELELYIYDSRDRAKHDRFLITKNVDGTITETKVGTVYKIDE